MECIGDSYHQLLAEPQTNYFFFISLETHKMPNINAMRFQIESKENLQSKHDFIIAWWLCGTLRVWSFRFMWITSFTIRF